MAKKQIAPFLGPNKGLSVVGEHAYAYSGTFQSVNAEQTMLLFTTGEYYTVGTFTFNAPVRIAFATVGGAAVYQISFNGQVVALGRVDSAGDPAAQNQLQDVIIPPLTTVEFIVLCAEDTATELITSTFAGRIYDA